MKLAGIYDNDYVKELVQALGWVLKKIVALELPLVLVLELTLGWELL